MRDDWDARTEENWVKAISGKNIPEEVFWASGAETYRTEIAPHIRGKGTAVEIGCGTGRLLRQTAKEFERVIGFDVSPKMVELARRLNPDFDIRLTDGRTLDGIEPGSVDLVYCLQVLHHVPERSAIRNYFREAARSLSPGGVLVANVSTRTGWAKLGPLPIPRLITTFAPSGLRRRLQAAGGVRADRAKATWLGGVAFFPSGVRRMLKKYGFSEVSTLDYGNPKMRWVVAVR